MAAEAAVWPRVAERDLKAVRNNVFGLEPLGRFSPYAIAFRYRTLDPDVLPDPPTRNDILGWLDELVKAKAAVAAAIVTET